MGKILGNLYDRTILSMNRMSMEEYRKDHMFTYSTDWPGDFAGRDLLALTSLYEAMDGYKDKQEELMELIEDVRNNLNPNEHFYQGPLFDSLTADEQQVSGNSWYIRGLIKYYKITGKEEVREELKSIVENFILKLSPFYDTYPLNERERGKVSGSLTGDITNGWKTSTDIGCAFMMTDGITDLYELLRDERLVPLIEKMIRMFSTADIMGLNFQTHATLTFTRSTIRYYESTGKIEYLEIAKKILDMYLKHGATLDLSNFNWFNRFDSWTEPCAIVDSMIALKKLYLITREDKYLNLFNKIYLNTIRTFQRNNGGAGCSTCATKENPVMRMHMYEAFFCCTMRLAEGLDEISSFSSLIDDNTATIPFNVKTSIEDEFNDILIDNEIYDSERIHIEVNRTNLKKLRIYVPEFSRVKGFNKEGSFITIDLSDNMSINIGISLEIKKDGEILRMGDMILSKKKKHKDVVYHYDGGLYSIINDNSKLTEKELSETEEVLI